MLPDQPYECDVNAAVVGRFFDLAVARHLQLYRAMDVKSVRQFIGGKQSCNAKLGGRFGAYADHGAVSGDVGGKDERGFPYKRWRLVNPENARKILAERHIKPWKADTIAKMKAALPPDTAAKP